MTDVFDNLENLLDENTTQVIIEAPKAKEIAIDEEHTLVPLDYRIFSTHNNLPSGKREPIDVYTCDRIKGIIPSGKAKKKADLLKQAFKNKTFFVEETSSKVYASGKKIVTVSNIVYQTL